MGVVNTTWPVVWVLSTAIIVLSLNTWLLICKNHVTWRIRVTLIILITDPLIRYNFWAGLVLNLRVYSLIYRSCKLPWQLFSPNLMGLVHRLQVWLHSLNWTNLGVLHHLLLILGVLSLVCWVMSHLLVVVMSLTLSHSLFLVVIILVKGLSSTILLLLKLLLLVMEHFRTHVLLLIRIWWMSNVNLLLTIRSRHRCRIIWLSHHLKREATLRPSIHYLGSA